MIKAIPTEYKGIRFDSKSEAVFARCLDLAGVQWVYHPGEHCGHEWDFLVILINERSFDWLPIETCGRAKKIYKINRSFRKDWVAPTLIEYKPKPPTKTYIENLTRKMRDQPRESLLVWGSPWSEIECGFPDDSCYVTYPIFSSYAEYGWGDFNQDGDNGETRPYSYLHPQIDLLGITKEIAQSAKAYRFDLASPSEAAG